MIIRSESILFILGCLLIPFSVFAFIWQRVVLLFKRLLSFLPGGVTEIDVENIWDKLVPWWVNLFGALTYLRLVFAIILLVKLQFIESAILFFLPMLINTFVPIPSFVVNAVYTRCKKHISTYTIARFHNFVPRPNNYAELVNMVREAKTERTM